MSKQYKIHWRRSDYSKLSHLIRKVNKKAFEIEVKRPDIAAYQPPMLDYQDVKKTIRTRQDFNNLMNKYNRYLREGVEEVVKSSRGSVATKWEINEFEIAQRAENTRRRATLERMGKMKVTVGGKDTGFTRAQMGKIKENAVKPSQKKFKNMSQREWDAAVKLFDAKMHSSYAEKKKQTMIEKYTKGLIAEGYSDELIELMNKIPKDKFIEIVDTDESATFDFIYDEFDFKAKNERLLEIWSKYADDNIDNGIKFDELEGEVIFEYEQGLRIKGIGRIKR